MKILVAVKRVVDYRIKVRVSMDGQGVELAHAKMSMNPFDEIALEEALRLKEAGLATEVIALSMGEAAMQDTLRAALAMGADTAVWMEAPSELEPLLVAKGLAAFLQSTNVGLVLLGKQAIDDDCNQTGQMLAALLGWPAATFASRVVITPEEQIATVSREVDGGSETVQVKLPAVITCDLRLNQPRYPSLPNIMRAKQKPLMALKLIDLVGEAALAKRLRPVAYATPPVRARGVKVANLTDLLAILQQEDLLS